MTFKNSHYKINRTGQKFDQKSETSKIGYESFSNKVLRFLNGDIQDFHANSDEEYDEDEGDWTDKEPEVDPMNSGDFDKIDALDLERTLIDKKENTEKLIKDVVNKSKNKTKSIEKIEEKTSETPVVTEVK